MGVELIDAHHRHVWRRIRQLVSAVAEGRTDEVCAALRFLHTYLAQHHADEERWMFEAGYPGAREHVRSHAEVLARIGSGRVGEADPSGRAALETAGWVAQALEAHMGAEDLRFGRFVTARENLRRLAEAGPGVGASLTPLPGSLPIAEPARREPPGAGDVERGGDAGSAIPRRR